MIFQVSPFSFRLRLPISRLPLFLKIYQATIHWNIADCRLTARFSIMIHLTKGPQFGPWEEILPPYQLACILLLLFSVMWRCLKRKLQQFGSVCGVIYIYILFGSMNFMNQRKMEHWTFHVQTTCNFSLSTSILHVVRKMHR